MTLANLRDRLSQADGRSYWRSLDELAGSDEFAELLHRELPRYAEHWEDAHDRRQFLRLMAASFALAGVSGCSPPPRTDTIMPYVRQPEQIVPGTPLFFATTMPHHNTALGLIVESHEGRPTKIEGNPGHPASLGATDAFAQANILSLYDPDRAQTITHLGQISTWEALVQELRVAMQLHRQRDGQGLYVLSEPSTSPTLARQRRQLLEAMPQASWHQYTPVNRDNARAGALLAFGRDVQPIHHFEQADIVVSLDANFLLGEPASVRSARHFMSRRQVRGEQPERNRLYVVESSPSNTGAVADHRLPLRASEVERVARALASRLGTLPGEDQGNGVGGRFDPAEHEPLIEVIVEDLQSHRGRSLVVAGRNQPPAVHALVHAINDALGNAGQTVDYIEPVMIDPVDQVQSLRELARALEAGQVQTLVILGANPVYDAPVDLDFAERLREARLAVQISMHEDETSRLCHWHVPQVHFLETWGDARTFDGTASIIQPLIAPLYAGRSVHEVLSALVDQAVRSPRDVVSETWQEILGEENFERAWQQALHDGVVAGTAYEPLDVSLQLDRQALERPNETAPDERDAAAADELELTFQPDPTVWDGRYANNGWLQELPKPLTKLTWDNAALVSPATAQRMGLASEEVVQLTFGERSVRAPIWILPGQPDNCVTVHLGYGRARVGRVGDGQGFDAYRLRTTDRFWYGDGLRIERTGESYRLATTQHHALMEGRDIVRTVELGSYLEDPNVLTHHLPHHEEKIPTLYPEFEYPGYAWGMSIDLTTCSGCNACVVACQAENNVPIVGKDGVLAGREMHWLRIDRYYEGEASNPRVLQQPMLCVHCEKAPCEVVCPVAATTHSHEGINEMTYNRCVGTRYCSNNCPYKVRRFNFLEYNADMPEVYQLQRNPDVTVRSRGVMEKCTYCVQRINRARIEAKVAELRLGEEVRIEDGDLATACQAACPSQSIVFGDLNDPQSDVSQLKRLPYDYGVLAELGTQPRTTYLAQFRNPHPRLAANDNAPPHA